MATWVDFKELRQKLKIADVLAMHNVKLKIKGDRATAFCPLPGHQGHSDGKKHSPSFSVHLGKGLFHCFSCQGKGNVLELACALAGGNADDSAFLRKTALSLKERFSVSATTTSARNVATPPDSAKELDPEPTGKFVVNPPLDFELQHLDPRHPYLRSRGFTHTTIEHFGLGYCAKGMMAGRIAIPLHDPEGSLIGYAGRMIDDDKIDDENPKYRFPGTRVRKGISQVFRKGEFLYNGRSIQGAVDELVIVEGFASVWWLWQHGFTDTVALMGNSVSERQAELIVSAIAPAGRCWIFADGDPAGERCAHDLFLKLAPRRSVRLVKIGRKQPTELSGDELSRQLN